ncbi:Sir2 silent information regulator family NAD-dependent deacetylase [Lactobacillus xujianguonis]|uniref:Sir2 silent information regulator family NAD-dependent deacetylase n=1 Tax=Lactobacillus xujianguonis TaxID=2495899 RepID=A0A437SU29_9LACO|nr:Sir2 silent information regulator family NAD-dependent deacetylase [Lactobacillus xujianguonis]RVU73669.1 Sir2 silent information regulator family NAD-dependent deacetylase [Lactobacillus xujianguonis]
MPDQIKDRSIGFSAAIGDAFRELLAGRSFGAHTEGPVKKQPKPELSPEEKAKQEAVMQKFYPNYMVDQSTRPGSYPMYLMIDKDHHSLLHTVQYGQSWMYSIGDAALVHCFTQDGNYYQVRLGLDKSKNEVHGFYADPGTFVAIETTGNNGVGFSQVSTDIPVGGDGAILVPRKDKLLQLFPNQRDIIERFSVDQ